MMTGASRAARTAVRTRWGAGLGCLLAGGALLLSSPSCARADSTLGPLLKPLGLHEYPSRVVPPSLNGGTVDHQQLATRDLLGKVILVNFWASWCRDCRPEMPVLERLHRELGRQGFTVIGINAREARDVVHRYARELGLTFPLLLDPDGKLNTLYGVVGLPTTFILGRDGRAVGLAVGPREWDSPSARALLQALLAEPVPRPSAP